VDGTHVADLAAGNAARVPDQPAIIDVTSATTLTWAQPDEAVAAEADRIAGAGCHGG
jgi:long-chain acyl-CoA synthetase